MIGGDIFRAGPGAQVTHDTFVKQLAGLHRLHPVGHQPGDLVLGRVRQLEPVGAEELDPVVVVRVVRVLVPLS